MTDLVDALAALTRGDRRRAAALANADTDSRLGSALATYLAGDEGATVYSEPAAFEAFIRGGGNVGLYDAVSGALADLYTARDIASVVDLGSGDGRAAIPAIASAHPRPRRLDLVEPSPALLAAATTAGESLRPITELVSRPVTAQQFVAELGSVDRWDLAQSTFALHTLPFEERTQALRQLRQHVEYLAIVEFDVPDLEPTSPQYLAFLAHTYEIGLAEYADDDGLVAQGFLMPVLVGQLEPGAVRVTFEQPASSWRRQVAQAGYQSVATEALFPYWSSPAFLLTACARTPDSSADGQSQSVSCR